MKSRNGAIFYFYQCSMWIDLFILNVITEYKAHYNGFVRFDIVISLRIFGIWILRYEKLQIKYFSLSWNISFPNKTSYIVLFSQDTQYKMPYKKFSIFYGLLCQITNSVISKRIFYGQKTRETRTAMSLGIYIILFNDKFYQTARFIYLHKSAILRNITFLPD